MTKLELATENGRRLATADPGRVAKAPKSGVQADMTVVEGFTSIFLSCLLHFRLNESPFVDARDPEALHQLRVATRRLRSALNLFRPILREGRRYPKLRKDWRRVGRKLGEARNLDIALTLLDSHCAELVKQARDDAYDRIADMLTGARFHSLTVNSVRWALTGKWRTRAVASVPLEGFSRWRVDKAWAELCAEQSPLSAMTEKERHGFRVRMKQFRYTLDFLRPLHRGAKDERKAFRKSIETLQDELGLLNDLRVAERMAPLNDCSIGQASDRRSRGDILKSAEEHRSDLISTGPYWRK
jgi:CHAD domain-containing protein